MSVVPTVKQVSAVAEGVRGLVAGLEPELVTAREAVGLWSGLEEVRRLVCGAQVLLARRVDESDAPTQAGLRNGAELIAQRSGGSLRSAYDTVATSKRLAALPEVTAALRTGQLSAVQATVIADAAAADPTAAPRLVDMARQTSLGELRKECLRVKAAADPDPEGTRKRIHRERRLGWFIDNEGAFRLSGRGPTEQGAELATVLGPIVDDIFQAAREAGVREPREAYTWDGLVEMARLAWAHLHGQSLHDHPDAPHQGNDAGDNDNDDRSHGASPTDALSNTAEHSTDDRNPGEHSDADTVDPADARDTDTADAPSEHGGGRACDAADAHDTDAQQRGADPHHTAAGRPDTDDPHRSAARRPGDAHDVSGTATTSNRRGEPDGRGHGAATISDEAAGTRRRWPHPAGAVGRPRG